MFFYKKKNGKLRLADGHTISKEGFATASDSVFCYWDEDCKGFGSFKESIPPDSTKRLKAKGA